MPLTQRGREMLEGNGITGTVLAQILEQMFLKPKHSQIKTLNISKHDGLVNAHLDGFISLDELAQRINGK